MNKPFKGTEIHDLLSQVSKEEITFSRFVEIINERRQEVIDKVMSYTDDTTAAYIKSQINSD